MNLVVVWPVEHVHVSEYSIVQQMWGVSLYLVAMPISDFKLNLGQSSELQIGFFCKDGSFRMVKYSDSEAN